MAVRVSNVVDPTLLFEFTCTEWALMSDATKADWTVTENSCGIFSGFGSPYAASDLISTLNGVIGTSDPINLTLIDGVYTIGISPATGTTPGSMSASDYLKAQTYLEPVSLNTVSVAIPAGAVTSITVGTALLLQEYVVGDVFSVVDNTTGARVKLTVTADTTAGGTTISATGTAAAEIPIGGILVPIYSARQFLTEGSGIDITGGVISNTAPDQTVVMTAGTGIGITGTYPNFTVTNSAPDQTVVLTQGSNITITGTYPNFTIAASGGVSDGDKGDITVSGGGTVWSIDALAVDTAELAAGAVTTAKIAADAVTYAKIQNVTANRVLGRVSTAGDVQELGPGTSMSFTGGGLIARAALTGDVTAALDDNATTIAANAVTTAKIINDAVTYAKIQNVSATNRVLGRITAAAGDVEELTQANLYTIMGMTGVTNRLAIWSGTNILNSDVAFGVDPTNDRMSILSSNPGLGEGLAAFNVGTSGVLTGAKSLFAFVGTTDGNINGELRNKSNTAGSNTIYQIGVGGSVAGDAVIQMTVSGVVTHAFGIDNSDSDKFKITPNATTPGGTVNSGLIVTNDTTPRIGINLDAPSYPLDVATQARAKQVMFTNNKPTAGAAGNGLGTGGSIGTINGADNAFTVTFTTGATGLVAGGPIVTMTYFTAWPTFAVPVFSAVDDDAANEITKFCLGSFGGSSFEFKVRTGQTLTPSTQYIMAFNVGGQG